MGEKKRISLSLNFIFNLISQLTTVLVPLIAMPHLTRILREDGNGIYDFSYAVITFFILLANLGFNVYGQREIAKYKDDFEKRSKIFWEIIIIKFFTALLSCLVLYLILFTVGFKSDTENTQILTTPNDIIKILSIMVVSSIFDIQFYFQGLEKFGTLAIRTVILRVVGVIGIYIFVKDINDIDIYAWCMTISMVGANISMWPSLIKRVKFVNVKTLEFKKHWKPALLIFLPTLAVTVYSVLDKTMIGWLVKDKSNYETGCYEQAYKINSAALLFVTVISPVLIPRNTHDYYLNKMDNVKGHLYFASNYVWMIGLPLIAGFLVLSNNLSTWYLGIGYEKVPDLLRIMSVRFILSGFGVIFGEQLFIAIGKEKYPTIATAIAAVLNILLNFILIPYLGAIGAAITTAVSEFVVTAILAGFVVHNKIISLKKILFMSFKYLFAAAVMFVPIYFMDQYLDFTLFNFILIFAVGVVTYFGVLFIIRDKFLLGILAHFLNKLKHIKTPLPYAVGSPQNPIKESIEQPVEENAQEAAEYDEKTDNVITEDQNE